MEDEKIEELVFIYGSLRKNEYNYEHWLKPFVDKKEVFFLGNDQTDSSFTLISMNNSFPAAIPVGDTSIKGEVFKLISREAVRALDKLEGFHQQDDPNNFYNKKEIETKFGKANIYVLEPFYIKQDNIIESGEWKKNE